MDEEVDPTARLDHVVHDQPLGVRPPDAWPDGVLPPAMVDRIGSDRLVAACGWAWQTAAGTGGREVVRWPGDLGEVPHEISDLWDDPQLTPDKRLTSVLDVYRLMPCYAVLMGVKGAFGELGPDERQALWATYAGLLDQDDDRLAAPVAYSLWVDFFEDPATVRDAWPAMTEDAAGRRLGRVLAVSGPVPWELKRDLYDALARDRRWHDALVRGLVGSTFDVYGQVDRAEAASLVARLGPDVAVPGLAELRGQLGLES